MPTFPQEHCYAIRPSRGHPSVTRLNNKINCFAAVVVKRVHKNTDTVVSCFHFGFIWVGKERKRVKKRLMLNGKAKTMRVGGRCHRFSVGLIFLFSLTIVNVIAFVSPAESRPTRDSPSLLSASVEELEKVIPACPLKDSPTFLHYIRIGKAGSTTLKSWLER